MSSPSKIFILLELCKIRIALPVALSCFTGYILQRPVLSFSLLMVMAGILLIVSSASILNHIQEYRQDAQMIRTKNRPIPSGKIHLWEALQWSIFFLLTGIGLLALGGTPSSLLLALATLIWYNGVYTPLKKITPFAVIPGALCGASPPMIGWLAAEGTFIHPTIVALSLFFFIGQIPHFWLILLLYGEDYKRAGFKVLSDLLSPRQIRLITLSWVIATAGIAMLLPSFGVIRSIPLMILLIVISIWLIASSLSLLSRGTNTITYRKLFLRLNLFFMCIMAFIITNYIFLY